MAQHSDAYTDVAGVNHLTAFNETPTLATMRRIWLGIVVLLGATQAWLGRQFLNPDGISYLDVGDAYVRGDIIHAINSYWSPLYSLVLGPFLHLMRPSIRWEVPLVHLVNFAIYLFAFWTFHYFWEGVIAWNQRISRPPTLVALPRWAMYSIGAATFVSATVGLCNVSIVTPDMLSLALILAATGIAIRILLGAENWSHFVGVGALLAAAYLAKLFMLTVAAMLLAVLFLHGFSRREYIVKLCISGIVFVALCAPFVLALSCAHGHFTYGDTGKLAYAWYVDPGVYKCWRHWQGGPPRNGYPLHPTRRIAVDPSVFEFATPFEHATYSPWFEPSYWNEGLRPYFSLSGQIRIWLVNMRVLKYMLFHDLAALMAIVIYAQFLAGQRLPLWFANLLRQWPLLIVPVFSILLYSLIHIEGRYCAGFIVLLIGGMMAGTSIDPAWKRPFRFCVLAGCLVSLCFPILTIEYATSKTGGGTPEQDVIAAEKLRTLGYKPGDAVAYLGDGIGATWARLSRLRIIAEVPSAEIASYWSGTSDKREYIAHLFAEHGAKAIVALDVPSPLRANWQQLNGTQFWVQRIGSGAQVHAK